MPNVDDVSFCPNDEIRKIMDTISNQIQNATLGWNPIYREINRLILSDISIIWRHVYNKNDIILTKNFHQATCLFFHRKDSSSAKAILDRIKDDLNLSVAYYANNIDSSYYASFCQILVLFWVLFCSSITQYFYEQNIPTFPPEYHDMINFFSLGATQMRNLSIAMFMSSLGSLFAWNRKNVFGYIDTKDSKISIKHVHWNIKKSQTLTFQSAVLGMLVFLLTSISHHFLKFDISNMYLVSIISFSAGMGGVFSEKLIKNISNLDDH